ncbi:MAG TPA: hypothetical protein VKY15_00190 [Acidimicrobiales bacterium]|nr:hypothetical protein [Acidimicrobiales bacterium]
MELSRLKTADRIVVVAGVLFVVNAFMPWASASTPSIVLPDGQSVGSFTVTAGGMDPPQGAWVVLALVVAVLMVASTLVLRLTSLKLPEVGVPWGRAQAAGGLAVLVLALLKLVAVRHFVGWASWTGVLLGAALAYGGALAARAPGEDRGRAGLGTPDPEGPGG